MSLLPDSWLPRRHLPPAEKPLRDELLSIERLEDRALALAASLTIDPNPHRRADGFASPAVPCGLLFGATTKGQRGA